MKSLGVDLDGVVWNSHKKLIDIYNQKYGENLQYKDFNKWGFLPEEVFWSVYKESSKLIHRYKMHKDVFSNLLGITNYFHISFLTHGLYTEADIIKKLKIHGIVKNISYDKIIIEDYSKKKVDRDFDFFIDDNPQMVEDIQKYPEKKLLLYTQPWNINTETLYNNVIRFNNWNEIYNYFMLIRK